MNQNCIFCDIVAGRSSASPLYRDSHCMAFMDIRPVTAGHLLIVPIQHATYLAELVEPAAAAAMIAAALRLSEALRHSGVRADGVNWFLADGEAAGQEVFHVHLHVFPRHPGDGFGLTFGEHYGRIEDRSTLDAQAKSITEALKSN